MNWWLDWKSGVLFDRNQAVRSHQGQLHTGHLVVVYPSAQFRKLQRLRQNSRCRGKLFPRVPNYVGLHLWLFRADEAEEVLFRVSKELSDYFPYSTTVCWLFKIVSKTTHMLSLPEQRCCVNLSGHHYFIWKIAEVVLNQTACLAALRWIVMVTS